MDTAYLQSDRGEGAAAPAVASAPGLLDAVLAAEPSRADAGRWQAFLAASSPGKALRAWLGPDVAAAPESWAQWLSRDIARLDELLTQQVNAILHHPAFQQLEASWRGLRYLVEQLDEAENIKVRMLSVSWRELARDAERAIEFDQSQLFRKVYSEEFDTPGGQPFGVLIGDYQLQRGPSADHPQDDLTALEAISHVAAAAFAPFVSGAHPSLFGLDDFGDLELPMVLEKCFDGVESLKWRALRETEDARFVGLALPRVLMRLPYADDGSRHEGFRFTEDVTGLDRSKYLWGNAAYAFAGVLVRSFAESGWLADIRGVRRDSLGGGLATGLPVHCFDTDRRGVAPKCSTEVIVTDAQEQQLGELGFLPLCHCKDSEFSAFYSGHSLQKPKRYDKLPATINARISAMLPYMLCVSRFAHYLKLLARDKVGSFVEAAECEQFLQQWLQRYVTADSDASPAVKAMYPLREAQVQVREAPGKPGAYLCTAHLWPHFELEELTASVKVTTELTPGAPA